MKLRDLTYLRPLSTRRQDAAMHHASFRSIAAAVCKVRQADAVAAPRTGAPAVPAASRGRAPYPLRSRLRLASKRERAAEVAGALGFFRGDGAADVQAYWGHLCAVAAGGAQVRPHAPAAAAGLDQVIDMMDQDWQLEAGAGPFPVDEDATAASATSASSTAPAASGQQPASPGTFDLESGRWDCLHW